VRRIACALAAILTFASVSFAQEYQRSRQHPWLRRVTLAAACATSFWDLHTTSVGVSNGAREANPLFADPLGRPRWGRMIGFKAGTCAASALAEEHFTRQRPSDRFWIGVNTFTAGSFTAVAIRNVKVAGAP
jgi:hypothetical protein